MVYARGQEINKKGQEIERKIEREALLGSKLILVLHLEIAMLEWPSKDVCVSIHLSFHFLLPTFPFCGAKQSL